MDRCAETAFNEVWEFGDAAYEAIQVVMELRESLRPYIAEQHALSTSDGVPVLRPMTFDFADADCAVATDQYMFGPRFLVAPVLEYGSTNRSVFLPSLPEGEGWVGVFDRVSHDSGWQIVDVPQNLTQGFPLFERVTGQQ